MEGMRLALPEIDFHLLLPFLIVVGTATLVLLVELFLPRRWNWLLAAIGLLGLIVASIFEILLWGSSRRTFGGMFLSDTLAVMVSLILLGATALTLLFAEDYLQAKKINFGEFYPLLLYATSGAMLMVSSTDLILIFLGLEILSLALYVLVGLARLEVRSEEAALKYFLLGAFASAFFLYGIAFIFGATGGAELVRVAEAWQAGDQSIRMLLVAGAALLLVGLGFKAALVPFHMWTPDVYQGAPTVVTAYMASVSKAAAFAVLIRAVVLMTPMQALWTPVLWWLAALTMTVGNLVAIVQRDAKRMLAYSSIAHAGYLVVGIVSMNQTGLTGLLFYLIAYSLMTIGAFGVLTLMVRAGDDTSLEALRGLWYRQPFASLIMVILLFSLAGIPPTAGFWGKWYLFLASVQANELALALILALNSVVGAFYYLWLMVNLYIEAPPARVAQPWLVPIGMVVCLFLCAAGLLAFGVLPSPLSEWSRQATQSVIGWMTAMR